MSGATAFTKGATAFTRGATALMNGSAALTKVAVTAVAAVALALTLLCSSCQKQEETPSLDVYESLREVNRLELARMTVGKVGMVSDPAWEDMNTLEGKARVLLNSVKVGKRIGVYSYDTYVTAYIDLSKLRPDDIVVDRDAGTVDILLPRVEVCVEGRDPLLHEEHYRVTGMRSQITPQERAALKARMAKEVNNEIATSRKNVEALRKSAEQKARVWISGLTQDWGLASKVEFR